MATPKKRVSFFESQEGQQARQVLISMVRDANYSTDATYSPNAVLYPNNSISFVEKHMQYLNNHPATNAGQYLANLRLITRV